MMKKKRYIEGLECKDETEELHSYDHINIYSIHEQKALNCYGRVVNMSIKDLKDF